MHTHSPSGLHRPEPPHSGHRGINIGLLPRDRSRLPKFAFTGMIGSPRLPRCAILPAPLPFQGDATPMSPFNCCLGHYQPRASRQSCVGGILPSRTRWCWHRRPPGSLLARHPAIFRCLRQCPIQLIVRYVSKCIAKPGQLLEQRRAACLS